MPQVCPLCSRVNPQAALYCYHDGVALAAAQSGPLAAGVQPFAYPFVFPSGRCCRNFDELLLACDDNWDAAKEVLRLGFLSNFFHGIDRPDLARAAKQAAKQRDADRGLNQLLLQMPGAARLPAQLAVEPLLLNLGQLCPGTAPRLTLLLQNEGGGMLYGSVTAEADWLTLGDGSGSPRKVFQFHEEFTLPVQVIARNLRASPKPIDGRLVVETNGGHALVVVRVEVPSQPFPSGVLAGALTPRDLAKMAKAAAKKAAVLFDNGTVRQWYESNGWTYPVRAPAATGLPGLQQFFESLGLAKPPRIRLSATRIQLHGRPGEALQYMLQVEAVEKKYVFVQARSTVGWLHVTSTSASGRRAQIFLRVPEVPQLPGQHMHGFLNLTANAGQRFAVEVHLTVQGERETATDSELIPVSLAEDLSPAWRLAVEKGQTPEIIPIAPMTLSDLLDAQAMEPEEG